MYYTKKNAASIVERVFLPEKKKTTFFKSTRVDQREENIMLNYFRDRNEDTYRSAEGGGGNRCVIPDLSYYWEREHESDARG